MNGFANHGLDEGAFGEQTGLSAGLRTFDAFRTLPLTTLYIVYCSVFPLYH